MRTVYDGELRVHYRQFYVESRLDISREEEIAHCAGQSNGLCGAANPGNLFLTTGLHTGRVGLTVEVHETEPSLDDQWEEIVEVSFRPASAETAVVPWGDGAVCSLDLPVTDYRVRYCGRGMDVTPDDELSVLDDGPVIDHYLLQFWPAEPAADQVIKQTTRSAAYWHDCARALPPPPGPEIRAEAERLRREAEETIVREAERQAEAGNWGGRAPSPTLREVGGNKWGLISLDRDLVDAVDSADAATQRDIARWAVSYAIAKAELHTFSTFARAIRALRLGEELPVPLGDRAQAWEWFFAQKNLPHTFVRPLHGSGGEVSQQATAMIALFAAVQEDPRRAALDAVYAAAATYGSAYPHLLAETRDAFPDLNWPS
ncbi:hypothetical protein [Streptomyces sp. AN091965]|uniref:hypothetical protein n=1 Tax=Streptomyces sp. AN091965 TaxID=2927803 RepID=UPI001F624A8C|nr:hypothetical protein [Streptomyces sp. AN091965]MCI3927878.1 hypothetical protein [Streptomyces sp. AN091965]